MLIYITTDLYNIFSKASERLQEYYCFINQFYGLNLEKKLMCRSSYVTNSSLTVIKTLRKTKLMKKSIFSCSDFVLLSVWCRYRSKKVKSAKKLLLQFILGSPTFWLYYIAYKPWDTEIIFTRKSRWNRRVFRGNSLEKFISYLHINSHEKDMSILKRPYFWKWCSIK